MAYMGKSLTEVVKDLLEPAIRDMDGYASSTVKRVDIWHDMTEDEILIGVAHRLFTRREIDDGTYKLSFRSRISTMLGADLPKIGREITVERRQLLARGRKGEEVETESSKHWRAKCTLMKGGEWMPKLY
jgi:hypothetical protein